MTPQERKVMELALEALEFVNQTGDTQTFDMCYADKSITAIKEVLAQPSQEFFKHNVEQPYEWSDWVCPDPKGYLMKCCDCGLVHEAEFGLVRYKSETEREYCDFVDDPNLQAVFRMRRSEQWSPEDTAHRAGGLPIAQPKQEQGEPVAAVTGVYGGRFIVEPTNSAMVLPVNMALYAHPPKREWVGLTYEDMVGLQKDLYDAKGESVLPTTFAMAVEAKLKEKNT